MKLVLISISMKEMDKQREVFVCLWQKCPKISQAKRKEGILVGPQITKQFDDQDFSTKLNSTERRDWKAFEKVRRKFIGKEKKRKIRVKV